MTSLTDARKAADACIENGDIPGAVAAWEAVLQAEPRSVPAVFAIAQLHFQARDFERAADHARRCLALDAAYGRACDILIRALVNLKDFEAAAEVIETHYPGDDDQAHSFITAIIASVWVQTNQVTRAIRMLRHALTVKPDAKNLRIALARQLNRQFRFREIEQVCSPRDAEGQIWLLAALAKARLIARDVPAARGYLDQMLSLDPEADRTVDLKSRLAALEAELAAGPLAGSETTRVIALISISYSGTTMLNSLLGSLPRCEAVSESSSMTRYRRNELRERHQRREADFSTATSRDLVPCDHCGPDCAVFDFEFRKALQEDPTNRFFKFAKALGCETVISSDKAWANRLDPLERYGAIVMYRAPYSAFASFRKRNHLFFDNRSEEESVRAFVQFYKRAYTRFLHEQSPQDGRLVLNWEAFAGAPGPHLRKICATFGLEYDAGVLAARKAVQHMFSGNPTVRDRFKAKPTEHAIRPPEVDQGAKSLFDAITERDHDLRALSDEMTALYRADFGAIV